MNRPKSFHLSLPHFPICLMEMVLFILLFFFFLNKVVRFSLRKSPKTVLDSITTRPLVRSYDLFLSPPFLFHHPFPNRFVQPWLQAHVSSNSFLRGQVTLKDTDAYLQKISNCESHCNSAMNLSWRISPMLPSTNTSIRGHVSTTWQQTEKTTQSEPVSMPPRFILVRGK